MRFFSLVAGAAFAAVAMAQSSVSITNNGFAPEAGKPFVITYTPPTAAVTLLLKNGPSGNLKTVSEIGKSSSGSVTWNVPNDLSNQQYAFEIVPASGPPNYSSQFSVKGATGAVSSAPASASVSSASPSASASASSFSSASLTITRTTASASASASASGNSTVSLPTLSTATRLPSTTGGSNTPTNSGSAPPQSTGGAATLAQSPLALILGAAAAMAYLA